MMTLSITKLLSPLVLVATIICGFADYPKNNTLLECPDYTFQLEEWRIAEVDGSFYIEHLYEEKVTQELYWDAGGPDLSEIIELTPDYIIIVYLSGSVGTSSIIHIYRGLIFDIWEMAFIGDFPYKYEDQNDQDYTLSQPEWTLKDDTLHVRDVNEGIDTVLEL